jgi:glycosyltransferase involved in cell wall biosynthesis
MKKTICHITTVHPRCDVRILYKECKSLTEKYDVNLIVADGLGDEVKDGIKIYDIGLRQLSRIKRMRIDSRKAFEKAMNLNSEIYHFHDPELISIGLKLKKKGKKVIYDVHEDLPRQIYGKPYLNKYIKPILSTFIEWKENKAAKQFDYICAATPFIRDRFRKINTNSIDINNYPILEENFAEFDFSKKENAICYVGGLAQYRGVFELIESLKKTKIKLHLAGKFETKDFEYKCKQSEGWKYVEYHGFIDRTEIIQILNRSKIGFVTLYPLVNYLDSLPVKMFEYMLAGIPVIASNFPYWERILHDNRCGVTVDPLSIDAIANATIALLNNESQMIEMGKNGRKAVLKKYNWDMEGRKLLEVYQKILEK